MKSCIREDESYGNVLIIDDVNHSFVHLRVVDNEAKDIRRVHLINAYKINSSSNRLDVIYSSIIDLAKNIKNCSIMIVDKGGNSCQLKHFFESIFNGNITILKSFGMKNFNKEYKARFFNAKSQCIFHTIMAINHGNFTFLDRVIASIFMDNQFLFVNDKHQYQSISEKDLPVEVKNKIPLYFYCLCAAFSENLTYIPWDAMIEKKEDQFSKGINVPKISELEVIKILEEMHTDARHEYDALEMSLLRDIKQIECHTINKCLKRVKEFVNSGSVKPE